MTEPKKTPHGTTIITDDGQPAQGTAGGGKDDGSPRATDRTGQPVTGTPPGGANSPGGALNTGPSASESQGLGGNNG